MTAILYKMTPAADKEVIDTLCFYVQKHAYERAEILLVDFIEDLMMREYNTSEELKEALVSAKILYYTFNEYYLNWITEKGLPRKQELEHMHAHLHDNMLFDHCTDPESMDDLMYEVCQYLAAIEDDSQMEEAQYHLDCYRRLLA